VIGLVLIVFTIALGVGGYYYLFVRRPLFCTLCGNPLQWIDDGQQYFDKTTGLPYHYEFWECSTHRSSLDSDYIRKVKDTWVDTL
jgi:hypothetical protein